MRGGDRRALVDRHVAPRGRGTAHALLEARGADGRPEFPVWFAAAGRPGAYLRIVEEGALGAGDDVDVVHRPGHALTVGEVASIYHGRRSRAAELLRAPELGEEWRAWVQERLAGARPLLPG